MRKMLKSRHRVVPPPPAPEPIEPEPEEGAGEGGLASGSGEPVSTSPVGPDDDARSFMSCNDTAEAEAEPEGLVLGVGLELPDFGDDEEEAKVTAEESI